MDSPRARIAHAIARAIWLATAVRTPKGPPQKQKRPPFSRQTFNRPALGQDCSTHSLVRIIARKRDSSQGVGREAGKYIDRCGSPSCIHFAYDCRHIVYGLGQQVRIIHRVVDYHPPRSASRHRKGNGAKPNPQLPVATKPEPPAPIPGPRVDDWLVAANAWQRADTVR